MLDEVKRLCPGTQVRVHRGDGLFFLYPAPDASAADALRDAGYALFPQRGGACVQPTAEKILALCKSLQGKTLSQNAENLRCGGVTAAEIPLFCRCAKLLYLPAAPGQAASLEKDLRRQAAICLRTKQGGSGVWAGFAILDVLNP